MCIPIEWHLDKHLSHQHRRPHKDPWHHWHSSRQHSHFLPNWFVAKFAPADLVHRHLLRNVPCEGEKSIKGSIFNINFVSFPAHEAAINSVECWREKSIWLATNKFHNNCRQMPLCCCWLQWVLKCWFVETSFVADAHIFQQPSPSSCRLACRFHEKTRQGNWMSNHCAAKNINCNVFGNVKNTPTEATKLHKTEVDANWNQIC